MHTVMGIYDDSDTAQEAVDALTEDMDIDESVSVVTKDDNGEVETETANADVGDGVTAGAATGGTLGVLGGIATETVSVALPAGTFFVAGPLVAAMGLAGGALGALAGGLVGGLIDFGLEEQDAQAYSEALLEGQTLVAVETDDPTDAAKISKEFKEHGAKLVQVLEA